MQSANCIHLRVNPMVLVEMNWRRLIAGNALPKAGIKENGVVGGLDCS